MEAQGSPQQGSPQQGSPQQGSPQQASPPQASPPQKPPSQNSLSQNLPSKNPPESPKRSHLFLFILYFLLLIGISTKLFFEDQFNATLNYLLSFQPQPELTLTIGFSEPLLSLNPLANDVGSRSRLLTIYEPLVRVNADLRIEPALAISYGALDDFTWEFKLRPNVFFHDKKSLTADQVVYSLTQSRDSSISGVKDLASTIKKIEKINDELIQITTTEPDPLLLSKLGSLLIFPEYTTEETPIGTGPYSVTGGSKRELTLSRFDDYWGDYQNIADKIILKTFSSKQEKIQALERNSVDIVANVPPDIAANFNFKNFTLQRNPSLEVNFLMFNFDNVFQRQPLREAVAYSLDRKELSQLAQGFATPAPQFVGNGIFGYNPDIKPFEFDSEKAKSLASSISLIAPLELDLPKGLERFGNKVAEQLAAAGIKLKLNFLSTSQLSKKIISRSSPFYFFGWRTDLGDAQDFLTAVVHSPIGSFGQFNGGNYKNPEVDRLIEASQNTLDQDDRLKSLRSAMRIITVEDVIGIPLFSPDVLYGISTDLKWRPRVDGYILAQEVRM